MQTVSHVYEVRAKHARCLECGEIGYSYIRYKKKGHLIDIRCYSVKCERRREKERKPAYRASPTELAGAKRDWNTYLEKFKQPNPKVIVKEPVLPPNSLPPLYACTACYFTTSGKGWFHAHVSSLPHRKSSLIRALLEKDCFTYTEIAKRVGAHRERIRQVAKQMGFAVGRDRQLVCKLKTPSASQGRTPSSFFVTCQQRGFTVEMDRPQNPRTGFVNGKLCFQRQGHLRPNGRYLHFTSPREDFDVLAVELPDHRFLILPREKAPQRSTEFSLEEAHEGKSKGAYCNALYYRRYIEAWRVINRGGD